MNIKIRFIPAIIMLGISFLVGYGFYAANASESQKWLMFGISSVEFATLLIAGFGIRYAERGTFNVSVLSIVFTIVALVIQFVFTILPFRMAAYIILNGILILVFLGITYALVHALNN